MLVLLLQLLLVFLLFRVHTIWGQTPAKKKKEFGAEAITRWTNELCLLCIRVSTLTSVRVVALEAFGNNFCCRAVLVLQQGILIKVLRKSSVLLFRTWVLLFSTDFYIYLTPFRLYFFGM